MPSALAKVRKTKPLKYVFAIRLVAGLPMLVMGFMHLAFAEANLKPVLVAADIPNPEIMSIVAPIIEAIAGVLILLGLYTRLAAFTSAIIMCVAIYVHTVVAVDAWPINNAEPPIPFPLAILIASVYLIAVGGGAWSLDADEHVPVDEGYADNYS